MPLHALWPVLPVDWAIGCLDRDRLAAAARLRAVAALPLAQLLSGHTHQALHCGVAGSWGRFVCSSKLERPCVVPPATRPRPVPGISCLARLLLAIDIFEVKAWRIIGCLCSIVLR